MTYLNPADAGFLAEWSFLSSPINQGNWSIRLLVNKTDQDRDNRQAECQRRPINKGIGV
jgi:hypothetical protein